MWDSVIQTLQRMLHVRGYPLQKTDVDNIDSIVLNLSTKPNYIHALQSQDKRHMVCLNNEKKVGIKSIRSLIDIMQTTAVHHAICVFMQPPTPFARRYLSNLSREFENLRIEYFFSYELMFDITQHKLMPRHVLLNNEEKEEVMQKYGNPEHCYPKIQLNDPMARYLGLSQGDMIRVERTIPNLGHNTMYRIACPCATK